jgi:hypothetical protein
MMASHQHRIAPYGSAPNLTPGRAGRTLGAMRGRRVLLVLVLVVFHVGLAATATLLSIDFAWAPSYFDDDDGDFLPLLLVEQMPARLDPGAAAWMPCLTLLSAVIAWTPRGAARDAAARVRFRAPPRP